MNSKNDTPVNPPRLVFTLFLLLVACLPQSTTPSAQPTIVQQAPFATPSPTVPPSPTPLRLPADLNPLSGLPVSDPNLLGLPALLVSISHFPAIGRPQAGLSFAPFVYEIYITEGATRFLAVYYGEFPTPEAPLSGECPIRQGAFEQTAALAGGRIWLDANGNGQQDVNESGIGGICVRLLDAAGQPLQETSSDSNGYYGFNVTPGLYWIEIHPPAWAQISPADQGEDSRDSD
ncbi:MAG: SdrD B-like domain-containing protein, partial [Anaerolineae bacterium]